MTQQEIIDDLAKAISDPECPVQFSPLLMGARQLLLRQATENDRLRATFTEEVPMLAYIAEIQRLLVSQYGFEARPDAPGIPAHVPDGVYPMEINGKVDRVEIKGGRIYCCNFGGDVP